MGEVPPHPPPLFLHRFVGTRGGILWETGLGPQKYPPLVFYSFVETRVGKNALSSENGRNPPPPPPLVFVQFCGNSGGVFFGYREWEKNASHCFVQCCGKWRQHLFLYGLWEKNAWLEIAGCIFLEARGGTKTPLFSSPCLVQFVEIGGCLFSDTGCGRLTHLHLCCPFLYIAGCIVLETRGGRKSTPTIFFVQFGGNPGR